LLLIDGFLDEETCARLRRKILTISFVSGATTAGAMAGSVKNNLQIDPRKGKAVIDEIRSLVLNDPRVDLYALPMNIVGVMVNRYDEGMEYGSHSDSPIMEGLRCDLSFTLFLEDPDRYDGGELALEQEHGLLKVKPAIGSLFVYSTGLLHRVTRVTRGSRLACVGWIQSRVRDESRRKALRDLNSVLAAHVQACGHDEAANLQLKVIGDLLRMWHE
jgi:PKHD-type hydroxylase